MRKNALAMSIATLIGGLGFVGAASADVIPGAGGAGNMTTATATGLAVNNGGIGHALITPYFNAQGGNATLISLVNTDLVNGKALKVRFRGASNSDDILDFTLLMSPGDIWNATITATGAGPAEIKTFDRTCSLPQLVAGTAYPFVNNRLTSKDTVNGVNANTREGYIEIFNMADINMGSALGKTILHSSSGVPTCSTTAINTAILDTPYTTANEALAVTNGLNTTTTGLFGDWAIINVPQTTTYSGQMVAIRAVTVADGLDARGNFVLFPQSASVYPGTIANVTADPLLRGGFTSVTAANVQTGGVGPAFSAAYYDMPDMSTPYTPATVNLPLIQAANLTASLAVKTVKNEYMTDASISGRTDWTFSMPTRRYSVAMDYSTTPSRRVFSGVTAAAPLPLVPWFHSDNTGINPQNSQQICVGANAQTFFDREEQTKTSGAVFSPGNLTVTQFCGETSVLSFGVGLSDPSALAASVARQDTSASAFTNGWGNIDVTNAGVGLPILGSAFWKATNPGAGAGFAGTYGFTFEHRFTR